MLSLKVQVPPTMTVIAAVGGHALHQLCHQQHAGGGAPEQDHEAERLHQDQDWLRPARHLQGAWKAIFSRLFTMDGAGHIILEPQGGFMGSVPAAATL